MEKDYQNFVDRMGSFEDTFDLTDDSIEQSDIKIVTRNKSALAHHGVLGMHWGKHKAINASTVGAAAKTGQSAAALGQAVNKNSFNGKTLKEAKSLSDDELKKLTNRLNLENNYMNAKTQQSGRSKVEGILSTAGATMALVSSAALMVDAINRARG
jgi:hypothetical protein